MPKTEFITNLKKSLQDDLKGASSDPHPVKFLKSFMRFFLICGISLVSFSLVLIVVLFFVIAPLLNLKSDSRGCCGKSKGYLYTTKERKYPALGSGALEDRVTRLEQLVQEQQDNIFWSKNLQLYTFDLPSYSFELFFLTEEGTFENRKYVYQLEVCNKNGDGTDCLGILQNSKGQDISFAFSQDEIIDSINVKAYQIAGVDGYVFVGNVQTDQTNYPFILYPNARDSDLYKYITDYQDIEYAATNIEFVEDIANGLRFVVSTDYDDPAYHLDLEVDDNGNLHHAYKSVTYTEPQY